MPRVRCAVALVPSILYNAYMRQATIPAVYIAATGTTPHTAALVYTICAKRLVAQELYIAGNRHYSTGTIEGPRPCRVRYRASLRRRRGLIRMFRRHTPTRGSKPQGSELQQGDLSLWSAGFGRYFVRRLLSAAI